MPQKGFTLPLIIIILFLIMGVLALGFYTGKSTNRSQAPVQSSPTLQVSVSPSSSHIPLSPEEVTENFYNNYLNCIENHFQKSNNKSPRENCPFRNSNLNDELVQRLDKALAYDPILCAQDTPASIKVEKAVLESNKANLTVHTFYEMSSDNPIKIELTKGYQGYWQITNITCSL